MLAGYSLALDGHIVYSSREQELIPSGLQIKTNLCSYDAFQATGWVHEIENTAKADNPPSTNIYGCDRYVHTNPLNFAARRH